MRSTAQSLFQSSCMCVIAATLDQQYSQYTSQQCMYMYVYVRGHYTQYNIRRTIDSTASAGTSYKYIIIASSSNIQAAARIGCTQQHIVVYRGKTIIYCIIVQYSVQQQRTHAQHIMYVYIHVRIHTYVHSYTVYVICGIMLCYVVKSVPVHMWTRLGARSF